MPPSPSPRRLSSVARAPVDRRGDDRGTSPVVGVVLLVGVTVVVAAVVGTAALGVASDAQAATGPTVSLGLAVEGDRIALTHVAGEPLDVRDLRLRIAVDGRALAHQPPVPFFAARGFRSGPTGPFNPATAPTWRVGQTASLRLAETNRPRIEPGSTVEVRVYVDDALAAELSTSAG
ncbi:MAG: type IV pilin [Haloferacaceae archaeon]